jgi:hypothetical protein
MNDRQRREKELLELRAREERDKTRKAESKKAEKAKWDAYDRERRRNQEEAAKRRAEDARQKGQQPQKKSGCFVATAAFGDYDAPEVVFLRTFRDESLSGSALGRSLIQAYGTLSPPLAAVIEKSELLRGVVREIFLQPIIFLLRLFNRR